MYLVLPDFSHYDFSVDAKIKYAKTARQWTVWTVKALPEHAPYRLQGGVENYTLTRALWAVALVVDEPLWSILH